MRTAPSKFWTFLIALFIGLGVTALGAVSPAAADAGITLDKKAPGSVLLGDNIPYELTAKNVSSPAVPQYNIGFSDVLPVGMVYVPGSVSPAIGEPTITINDGRQVLAWTNVSDLQANSTFTITYEAKWPNAGSIPTDITPTDINYATVASQTDPRKVPKFNADGTPTNATNTANDSETTKRAPFIIEKSEPSPEGELLRGVHKKRTVYTLKISNNKVKSTENITVTDYLPAGLEFLGCGDEDNTQPITEKEYTGADRLGVPPFNGPTCPATFLTPTSVDTVLANPTGDPLKRDAVWTKVDWTIGTLAPGSEPTIIKYVAAIPLKENTTTWAETKPSAASGKQGSNLNNNNGDSTREGTDEQTLTNYASATGTFTGTPNAPYTDRTTESVQVEDIRMQKSVDTDRFVPGNIAEFTINIDASEYMKGSEIVVTDTLPDGYCPLGAPGIGDIPEACTGGAEPTTDYASVTWNGSAYIIEFKPIAAVDANESKAITFQARMLKNYRGKSGAPTVAGDSFTNDVRLTGKTNPIAGVSSIEPGELTVKDNSEASQGTRLPTIDKQVQATRTPVNCATTTYTKTVPTFQQGDRVCFKLRVNFPNIDTKNAVVTDFLPPDSQYIAASTVPGSANTLTPPPGEPTYTDSAGPLTWTLGNTIGAGRFVDADKTFEVVFAVRLLESAGGVTPEITGNLMKMRTENTKGDAESYRDQADFTVAPPKLALVKGAIQTNKPAGLPPWPMPNNPGLDTQTVQQGSTTTFQIDVKNNEPATPAGAGSTVRGVETWDVLPSGIACSAISGYKVILPGASAPPHGPHRLCNVRTATPACERPKCLELHQMEHSNQCDELRNPAWEKVVPLLRHDDSRSVESQHCFHEYRTCAQF